MFTRIPLYVVHLFLALVMIIGHEWHLPTRTLSFDKGSSWFSSSFWCQVMQGIYYQPVAFVSGFSSILAVRGLCPKLRFTRSVSCQHLQCVLPLCQVSAARCFK